MWNDPICTVDPDEYLKIVRHPDGSITRHLETPNHPATPDSTTFPSKDVPLNPTRNTWLRIHLPNRNNPQNEKLPLIIYFHGGGFVLLSAETAMNHDLCKSMAAELNALVISVEYRLAPEHRLPAAYQDAIEALRFAQSRSDAWLRDFADTSRIFLAGTSAGGNIAYRAALESDGGDSSVKIRGLILHHPFFGGVRRTPSEIRLVNDPVFPLSGNDLLWELSLPIGVDRDHKYSNPTAGEEECGVIGRSGIKVLVIGCDGDPLIDRQVELVKMLKSNGVDAVGEFSEGGFHGVELVDDDKAKVMFELLKSFIK